MTTELKIEREAEDYADLLRRELLLVQDVKKIAYWGEQAEAIYVEISKTKVNALGITLDEIFQALQVKNLPSDAGRIKIGSEYMPLYPSGVFKSEQDFGDLLISSQAGKLVQMKDGDMILTSQTGRLIRVKLNRSREP